jgi:NADH-quinone oxidoreductase subunit F
VPCRIGTVRQEESLHRLGTATSALQVDNELVLMKDLAQVMTDASICGLGQTAASAVQSGLRKLPLYRAGQASRTAAVPGAKD